VSADRSHEQEQVQEPAEGTPRVRALRPWRRVAMHLLAAFVIYGNVAVALQPRALFRRGIGLPRPDWVTDAFLMTGMFGSYVTRNADLFIGGERTHAGRLHDRGRWIPLDVGEHFPSRLGVAMTELFAVRHWDTHGRAAQHRAWVGLAARIRAHHNRLHPDAPVGRVRFGQTDWPQDPAGYRAKKHAPYVRATTWFEERPSPARRP
jgi:hypothetical protein